MSSRDLVREILKFEAPARVPRQMWLLPWANENHPGWVEEIQATFPDDIVTCPVTYKTSLRSVGDRYGLGTYVDDWGCVFQNRHKGIIGQVKKPLLERWDDLEKVRMPVERLSVDLDEVKSYCQGTDRFVLAPGSVHPFERLQFIRGTENLLIDLIEQPSELAVLIDRIHGLYTRQLKLWADTDVDGLVFADDWGGQNSLLISPEMWRRLFKQLYRDYIDIAHAHGKYAFMHSDGYIMDILPDLIELGLDAINAQVFCMGVEELGKRFAGKITFWGEIDRQHVLPHGTTEDVYDAVGTVRRWLYRDGGVIAQCEFGPGAKPENVYSVFKAWDKL